MFKIFFLMFLAIVAQYFLPLILFFEPNNRACLLLKYSIFSSLLQSTSSKYKYKKPLVNLYVHKGLPYSAYALFLLINCAALTNAIATIRSEIPAMIPVLSPVSGAFTVGAVCA